MKTFPKCVCGRSLPILDVPGTVFRCCGAAQAADSRRNTLDPDAVFGGAMPDQAPDNGQGVTEDGLRRRHG